MSELVTNFAKFCQGSQYLGRSQTSSLFNQSSLSAPYYASTQCCRLLQSEAFYLNRYCSATTTPMASTSSCLLVSTRQCVPHPSTLIMRSAHLTEHLYCHLGYVSARGKMCVWKCQVSCGVVSWWLGVTAARCHSGKLPSLPATFAHLFAWGARLSTHSTQPRHSWWLTTW